MADKKPKKKATRGGGSDVNQIAARILRQATGEEPKAKPKSEAAVKRGKARATPAQGGSIRSNVSSPT